MISIKQKLIEYLAKRKSTSNSAFTLVELIVVVVIIGILSAIAIPSFQNAGDKAKQKEASTLVSSYIKAAQAYYTEYSMMPDRAAHLGQYVAVTGCRTVNPSWCKTNAATNYTTSGARSWASPSGYFQIYLQRSGTRFLVRALPGGQYARSGFGVAGCFNSSTGSAKVVESTTKGRNVRNVNC